MALIYFNVRVILTTIGVLAATGFAYIIFVVYRHRSHINDLRKQGWPMPAGWSWLTGHSLVLLPYSNRFPPLANVSQLAVRDICREFPETEMFLLDMWPSYPTLILSFNPESAVLMSNKYNLPKPPMSGQSVKPIVGGPSLLSMNGNEWKIWRSRFNPGFSAMSLNEHVPYVADRVQVFCDKLRANAGRGIFSLDDFASRLTFEVIMKVTLDVDIDYQHSEHALATAFNTITRWHSFWDIRVLMNPLRPLIQTYYGNIIKKYVRRELEQRFAELRADRSSPPGNMRKAKSVAAVALQAYMKENEDSGMVGTSKLDDTFADIVTNQVRLFLFAGNDTTSSTIAFIYHMLSKHQESCSQLRQEHDAIFGTDVSKAGIVLKEQPALLNQCRYTMAVIKETLRLYPPTSNMRLGVPGVPLTALNGLPLPTNGIQLIVNHPATHRNPRIWVQPDEFLPERWLVQPGHELYPPENAWRPFDTGPRACIGQSLSLNEMRIVLIMTMRSVVLKPAYDEWD